MRVGGLITESEFIRFNMGMFYRRPAILLLHVALGGVGLYWFTSEAFQGVPPWSPLAVMAALFVFYRFKSQRLYQSNKLLRSRTTYETMEDGLRIELPDITPRKVDWDKFAHLIEQPKHIILYGAGNVFVIPKHWFDTLQDADAFLNYIREKTDLDPLTVEAKLAARKRKTKGDQPPEQSPTGSAPLASGEESADDGERP